MRHALLALSIACAACTTGTTPSRRPLPDASATADGGVDAGLVCLRGRHECAGECCPTGSICGDDDRCCPFDDLCGSACCRDGQVCEGASCHLDCGESARCEDASGAETCCADGEVCATDRCVLPTVQCSDFVDCRPDEYCDPVLRYCLPQPSTGEACELPSTGGGIAPTLVWHWDGREASHLPSSNQVVTTPIVVQLTDDDESGGIDRFDTPDVLFTTFTGGAYEGDGVLRAVRGESGAGLWDAREPVHPMSQIAAGDLDGDGVVEIVACGRTPSGHRLMAFEHDGTLAWVSTDARVSCVSTAPTIADLDADGTAEVVVRYSVLDGRDGTTEWHHECRNADSHSASFHSPCDLTTAADLDGDGMLEVVGGNAAYRADGLPYYDRSADFPDGYPAIADLDLDGVPEVVVVHSAFLPDSWAYRGHHHLRALRADGTDLWGPIDVNAGAAPAGDLAADTVAGGGAPTIANFDEDAFPEIALAGAFAYVVLEHDGTVKWVAPTHDHSSRKTGSSVFDFDGDGVAEAVYNDEFWLRVYDGRTGEVRYCECNTNGTYLEYPVIADVDGDEHAEIVVASNDYAWDECPSDRDLDECTSQRVARGDTVATHGVRVFAGPDRDWVATRRIWNQHGYHVTNVDEDGRIPAGEVPNWTIGGLNNFRQNVLPGATNAADLIVAELAVDVRACPRTMVLYARVRNVGWSGAIAGVPVRAYRLDEMGDETPVGTARTTRFLLPGESDTLRYDVDVSDVGPMEAVRFRVRIDSASSLTVECRDTNNEAETTASCDVLI